MRLLDFLRNYICLIKLPFLASLSLNFSTICSYMLSKFINKSTQKKSIFSSKANYARSLLYSILLLACCGCSSSDEKDNDLARIQNASGEYIYRIHDEYLFKPQPPAKVARALYPWESHSANKITKEYFRCKGSSLNPPRFVQQKTELVKLSDCGGCDKHSLPLNNNKEFIYPILIDILNYIQDKSGQKIVITSGHRCPDHNTYVDGSKENQSSKHMIGAEVSFYVQGWEDHPEKAIQLIQDYYKTNPKYAKMKEFQEFERYEKGNTNVLTPPWMNKEIFIKLFKKKEGRNFDNRHPYPYVSIQVRYDTATNEKVIYTWEKANRNFLRK
jgi:hypothetical protein